MGLFMDMDNKENKDVKIAFDYYRFFGKTIPGRDMVERWMAYNMVAIEELQYKDMVYLPSFRIEVKLLFQHELEKNKPQKCREKMVTIDWSSNESFIASMRKCIKILAVKKDEYLKNRAIRGGDDDEDELPIDQDVDEAKGNMNDEELQHKNMNDSQIKYRYWESRSNDEDDTDNETENEDDDVNDN